MGDIGSHWLDLTSFVTGRHVDAVMADLATFVKVRHKPTGRVETFSLERSTETMPVDINTEDAATILLRYDNGARGVIGRQPDQCRAQELAPVRDRWLECGRGVGLGATRQAVAGLSWPAQRAAHARLALMNDAGRAAAALPGGHVEGFADTFAALSAPYTATWPKAACAPTRLMPRSATATRRCSWATQLRRAPLKRRWIEVAARQPPTGRPALEVVK